MIGISGICNILASIKAAKYYEMTEEDVILTIATDSADMYVSRVEELRKDKGDYTEIQAAKDSAMAQLRSTRNALLLACDWTQMADCTIPKKTEWATYRQTLRDFPATVSDARINIEWPHNPDWVDIGL